MLCLAWNNFLNPLFTDQGPLITTALVLQGDKQTIEDNDGEELERTLKIFLNIMICVIYFIQGTFHHSATSMKCLEKIIQQRILNASCAHTQHNFLRRF